MTIRSGELSASVTITVSIARWALCALAVGGAVAGGGACAASGTGAQPCAVDLDCEGGLHCTPAATCERDCAVASDCGAADAVCDDRGRCVAADDASSENPFEGDPDYESTQDLGGAGGARQPYGTNVGAYRGVPSFSNYVPCAPTPACWFDIGHGRTTGTYGYEYQCVEYAVRFYAEALGYTGLNGNGDARRWWTAPKKDAGRRLTRYANNNVTPPAPDDLIVFDGNTTGHIAVIREVGPDHVYIIQQNWFHNASDARHRLEMQVSADGRYTIEPIGTTTRHAVLGWLRRPDAPVTCSCPDTDGDGVYATGCADAACAPRTDCNNANAAVHPGAVDVCGNGIDEDCTGGDCAVTCSCPDTDGDGFYATSCADAACAPRTDCNNANGAVHPGAVDVCGNGIDEDCSGSDCQAVTCGDGACAAGEDPSSCAADCAPTFVDQVRLGRGTNGGCASTGTWWHPAGGNVHWTFATSCQLPTVWMPDVYGYEYGRWRFQIRKPGRYRVAVKIPPSGAACGFPVSTYTTAARYMMVRPGLNQPGVSYTVNQQMNVDHEADVTSSVLLQEEGQLALYLYDSVADLANCCECATSKRVMFDYARVTWVGP